MKLREFLNASQNDISEFRIYFDDASWEHSDPDRFYSTVYEIPDGYLDTCVDIWYLDGTVLDILLAW